MSQPRDPDLEGIFDRDPSLERYARLLKAGRLKPPPLDPGFRHGLRRELMTQAYDRYDRRARPGLLARIFTGPRMAGATVLVGAVLVGFLLITNGNLLGSGNVTVTTVGAQGVDQPILVSFSQPMDHQSVEQAIQVQPATQVTYAWQGNNLLIQPVSGSLAPNTQYHVTISAAARTAPGTPIGHAATVAVTTAPLPSPSPSPTPSPTPPPAPAITAEHALAGTSGTVVGFSGDGQTIYFLTASGDLDQVGADGGALATIEAGVTSASVAPGGAALAFATGGSAPAVYLATPPGSAPQAIDSGAALIAGWVQGKPFLVRGEQAGTAGSPLTGRLPGAPSEAVLAPDGSRLLGTVAPAPAAASPSPAPAAGFLYTVATQAVTPGPVAAQDFAWSPDSSRVAFWAAGAIEVAAPDGSSPVTVARVAAPVRARWTDDGRRLLFGGPAGAWLVNADGSGLTRLSSASFQAPAWAPGNARFAFFRAGSLWIDDIATGAPAGVDLGAAAAVVDAYEKARIAGDLAGASGQLAPSASPASPPALSGGLQLARYFVISSQATPGGATFTVRLVYARGSDEVRYQDESLALAGAASGLKIASITDYPLEDLGNGPTVNSVAVKGGQLELVFDSDLDPATVAAAVSIAGPDGRPVPVTTSYDHRRLTVSAQLTPGARYQLAIAGTLKDIAGQPLQGGFVYPFVAPAAS